MKKIHSINKWSFISTILLFLTVYMALIGQALLGIIQLTLALIILFHWKRLHSRSKILISIYWLLVLTYGAIVFSIKDTSKTTELLFIIIIPMTIATYFLLSTYLMTTKYKATKH